MEITFKAGLIMAGLGICIVFSGLVFLLLFIALLSRFLRMWDACMKVGIVPYFKGVLAGGGQEQSPPE
ncbi:OadG family protein [Thermodesulfobacteriota bacterium]